MKVAFIPSNVSGVVFYRVWQPALQMMKNKRDKVVVWWWKPDQFEMHPWEGELSEPEIGPSIGRDINAACAWADVVVWMGLHQPASLNLFHQMRATYDKPFVTEMDDYIFSIPEANIASTVFRPGMGLTRIGLEQIKASDALIVSTPYLAQLYKPFNPQVHVVENAVDLALWRTSKSSPGRQRVTIGWMGGGTHREDLALVKDAVFEVLDRYENASFTFLHACPDFFKGHKRIKEIRGFKAIDKYPAWVAKAGFDIGIAPLVDNNFNRGKSNLRWLEYSALGIPTVASPLPHFKESIREGETGLLANATQEWVNALGYLIENEEARLRIGKQAQQEVKERWNPYLLGRKYRKTLEEITFNARTYQVRPSIADRGLNRRSEQYAVVGNPKAE